MWFVYIRQYKKVGDDRIRCLLSLKSYCCVSSGIIHLDLYEASHPVWHAVHSCAIRCSVGISEKKMIFPPEVHHRQKLETTCSFCIMNLTLFHKCLLTVSINAFLLLATGINYGIPQHKPTKMLSSGNNKSMSQKHNINWQCLPRHAPSIFQVKLSSIMMLQAVCHPWYPNSKCIRQRPLLKLHSNQLIGWSSSSWNHRKYPTLIE